MNPLSAHLHLLIVYLQLAAVRGGARFQDEQLGSAKYLRQLTAPSY